MASLSDHKDATGLRDAMKTGSRKHVYGRCIFCGGLSFGRVCRAHRDLLDIEDMATRQPRDEK
jgi:hypothetical protein